MSVKMNTIYLIRLLSQPNLLRRPPIYYTAAAAAARRERRAKRCERRTKHRGQLAMLHVLLLLTSSTGSTYRQLQPLVEASGAAHGDRVTGGRFCHSSHDSLPPSSARPVLAVLEAASLSVSLLAGPTPYLVRRLTPVVNSSIIIRDGSAAGALTSFTASDLDGDSQDELVVGWASGQLLVLQFSADCSSVAIVSRPISVCTDDSGDGGVVGAKPPSSCRLAALLPVPRAVTPAGLVAVRSLHPPSSLGSSAPFALLAAAVSGGVVQLTVHSFSDFGVPAPLSSPWVAASASANRSLLLLLRSSGAPVFLALLHE
jgi:hypothetical protein